MINPIIHNIEQKQLKQDVPSFEVGDTVDVATLIREGEKQRVQVFTGTVIMRKGAGVNQTFTVRRIVNNEGVERIYPLHSPFVQSIKVRRSGQTRRAKLYYLRDRVGKATRLAESRKARKPGSSDASSAAGDQPQELASAAS